jgi:hypothetical protein
VIQPLRRRWDIALGVLLLLGLVIFQQVNAMPIYTTVDKWLNAATHFPSYPNPIDYVAVIAAVTAVVLGYVELLRRSLSRVEERATASFTQWLMPVAYGLIPLVAADYLARQLPRFFDHLLRIVPAISDPFDYGWNLFGTAHSPLYGVHLLSTAGVVRSQVIVIAIGAISSIYATWHITQRDIRPLTGRLWAAKIAGVVFNALLGAAMIALYIAMAGAQ